MPLHAHQATEGIHLLREMARAGFFQAPALQQQILPGRIGRVIGGDVDRPVHAQSTRSGQLVGLAVGIHQLGEHAGVLAELAVAEHAHADPLDRIDRVERGVAVVVVLGGRIRLVEIAVATQHLVEIDPSAIGQQRTPAHRGGAARAHQLAIHFGQAAGCARAHVDRAALGIVDTGHQRTALAGDAPSQVDGGFITIATRGLAVTHGSLGTVKTLLGDDVDHAGDRIGAVDGRSAVLEHFHALDQRHRNHVQIDRAVGAGAAVDDAAAIEQHQGAVDAQPAQVDLGGAVAVLGPVGIALAAGKTGRGRQALQQGVNRSGTGAFNGLCIDHADRADPGQLRALDMAAGDLHGVQRAGGFIRGLRVLRIGGVDGGGTQQCTNGRSQGLGLQIHVLSRWGFISGR